VSRIDRDAAAALVAHGGSWASAPTVLWWRRSCSRSPLWHEPTASSCAGGVVIGVIGRGQVTLRNLLGVFAGDRRRGRPGDTRLRTDQAVIMPLVALSAFFVL
jgi:hypothetical protein